MHSTLKGSKWSETATLKNFRKIRLTINYLEEYVK